jgi:DNA-binding LacI/PurR family transcriptional regulator
MPGQILRQTGIREMARSLSLSVGTISKALNGHSGVRAVTRQRVLTKAAAIGYIPNYPARALRQKRTRCIGLLLPTLANPVYSERMGDIYQACAEQGYEVSVTSFERDAQQGIRLCRDMIGRRVEAVILTGGWGNLPIRSLLEADIKVLMVNPGERVPAGAAVLNVDKAQGARLLLRHLIELGHRRPLLVGNWAHDAGRKRGVRQALSEAGYPQDEFQLAGESQAQEMMQNAFEQTLEAFRSGARPTAIMASNDLGAIGAIAALCQTGLSVPRDVSVTGMDNIASARFCQPPLTTVSQTHLHLGRRAVEMVISILEGRSPPEIQQHLMPQLVVRQSTGPARPGGASPIFSDPST